MSVVREDALFCATVRTPMGDRTEVSVGTFGAAILMLTPTERAASTYDLHSLLWLHAVIGEAIEVERERRR